MTTKTKSYVGKKVKIAAGTRVQRAGRTYTREIDTVVTVRAQEAARGGKTRIVWKSNGLRASTLI